MQLSSDQGGMWFLFLFACYSALRVPTVSLNMGVASADWQMLRKPVSGVLISCFVPVPDGPRSSLTNYLVMCPLKESMLHRLFYFLPKLRVLIKDNTNLPHSKFHRFLFPFSSKFPDLNSASYVFCIYTCYVTWHTQWAWVTCGKSSGRFIKFSNTEIGHRSINGFCSALLSEWSNTSDLRA